MYTHGGFCQCMAKPLQYCKVTNLQLKFIKKIKHNQHVTSVPILILPIRSKFKRTWPQHTPTQSLQSCPTACNPMDYSLPSSSVCGVFQARILEWVAIPSSRGTSCPRDQPHVFSVSSIADAYFTAESLVTPSLSTHSINPPKPTFLWPLLFIAARITF